ncbi:hypothetical protein RRG08_028315 [Elysia crispata]|uniref:Uncharacterized protein n=1 Tax=Elysia crispata TaxID=231223 RepID=A0AAE1AW66_9GAST|nr:hypothetical protein RRG08_028315 [Elysia crispata]
MFMVLKFRNNGIMRQISSALFAWLPIGASLKSCTLEAALRCELYVLDGGRPGSEIKLDILLDKGILPDVKCDNSPSSRTCVLERHSSNEMIGSLQSKLTFRFHFGLLVICPAALEGVGW